MTTTNDTFAALEHSIGETGRLTIKLAAADIRVTGGDGDRVIVRTADGAPLPGWIAFDLARDSVTIRGKETFGLTFALGSRTVSLDVQVPAGAEVTIETASGDVGTEWLRGAQRLKTVTGDIRVGHASGPVQVVAVSGDAAIELDRPTTVDARSVSGDVRVRGARVEALRLGTTSGDIRIDSDLATGSEHTIETLSGDVDLVADGGLRIDARTVSGDLMSDLPHRTEGSMGRRALIIGDGATRIAFRSVSGDLRIRSRSTAVEWDEPSSPPRPTAPAADMQPDQERDEERMTILRALERGELDVGTATDRLAELDAADGDLTMAAGDLPDREAHDG
jgi:hypothetical protein